MYIQIAGVLRYVSEFINVRDKLAIHNDGYRIDSGITTRADYNVIQIILTTKITTDDQICSKIFKLLRQILFRKSPCIGKIPHKPVRNEIHSVFPDLSCN